MLTLSPVTYSHSLHRQASHATLSPVRLLLLNNLEVEHFWMPPYQAGKGLLTQQNPGTQMAASRLPLYLLISWPSQFVEQVWRHEHPCLHITLIWMTTFFLKFDWSTVALQCGLFQVYSKVTQLYICIYPFFSRFFPVMVITEVGVSFQNMGYTIGPCWLSVLYIVVCISLSQIPTLSLSPPLFPLVIITLISKSVRKWPYF